MNLNVYAYAAPITAIVYVLISFTLLSLIMGRVPNIGRKRRPEDCFFLPVWILLMGFAITSFFIPLIRGFALLIGIIALAISNIELLVTEGPLRHCLACGLDIYKKDKVCPDCGRWMVDTD